MALLGKLAAGTAHSIRNLLTSVKMRLFSLNRSCTFTDGQQKEFNVIPFFTTKDHATGLGLSIAYNIIAEHGGWLDVSSKEGQGATFVITLPVRDVKDV